MIEVDTKKLSGDFVVANIECPTCFAAKGEPCKSALDNGKAMKGTHPQRDLNYVQWLRGLGKDKIAASVGNP